jgi:hypothetical protein
VKERGRPQARENSRQIAKYQQKSEDLLSQRAVFQKASQKREEFIDTFKVNEMYGII